MVGKEFIAKQELLACVVGIFAFREVIQGRLVTMYTDSQTALSWLQRGRCSDVVGSNYLSVLEMGKYKAECKVQAKWISSGGNRTADMLSRNKVPDWLQRRGIEQSIDIQLITKFVADPVEAWRQLVV